MGKRIAVLIGMILVGATAVRADFLGLKDWKVDGSLEVLGNQANNETDYNDGAKDSRGNTITRVRLGADMGITEDVTGRVELVRNGGADSQYGSGDSDLNNEQNAIKVENAYVNLSNFIYMDQVRLGRQYAGRKGDLLAYFGPVNDDRMSSSYLDALSVSKKFGKVLATFVTGKFAEDDGVPGSGTETDANAEAGEINVTWGTLSSDELIANDMIKVPVELGYYQGTNAYVGNDSSDNDTLTIADVRIGAKVLGDKLSVMGEYAMNGGQSRFDSATKFDYKGNALTLTAEWADKDLGYSVRALYANASGDDQVTVDGKDKSFHDFSTIGAGASDFRYGEILSNSNSLVSPTGAGLDTGFEGMGLNVTGLSADYTLPVLEKKVQLKADYFMAKVNKVVAGADKGIGNELDLAVKYAHSDTVCASVGYAMLMPDDGLANGFTNATTGPDDNITKLWAKLSVKWGNQE